jgi:UPF0716 protein FxsA
MRFFLPLVFLLPIIEITLLIKVGQQVGVLYTLALLFLMGVVGMFLLRLQGFSTLLRVNERLQQGDLPAKEILNGVILAMAAVLFMIPGFFTDILAFLCLLPPVRFLLIRHLLKNNVFVMNAGANTGFYSSNSSFDDDIIEGEYSREDRQRLDK